MNKIKWKCYKKNTINGDFFEIQKQKNFQDKTLYTLYDATYLVGNFKKLSSAKTVANLLRHG